jgi:lipopolysaccharide export system ATP-binding protein
MSELHLTAPHNIHPEDFIQEKKMQTTPKMEIKNLNFYYGKFLALKNINMTIPEKKVTAFIGPSGCGKSTLLRTFNRMYQLYPKQRAEGEILLDGERISGLPIHRRAERGLSYLPQEASVFRKLSVEDNIRAVLELQKSDGKPLSREEIDKRLNTLLEELQIDSLRQNPALSLSGGERRRVEIARALATNPRFILLDEPFAGVDPIAVIEIQRIVRFLKARGIGVLITDHNVRETLDICDRAYIINQGSVLASGSPDEIIANESVRRVYLGENFRR